MGGPTKLFETLTTKSDQSEAFSFIMFGICKINHLFCIFLVFSSLVIKNILFYIQTYTHTESNKKKQLK